MKKFIYISLLIIASLAIIIYINFSSFTKALIEDIASNALKVNVTISEFNLDISNKSVELTNINISNPEGFSEPNALKLGNIKIKLGEISNELINIKTIDITDTNIFLEVTDKGTNLREIANNTKSKDANDSPKSKSDNKNSKDSPKVIIDKFQITGTTIDPKITLNGNNNDFGTINLPDILLNDIGKKENGLLAEEAITQIIQHVIKSAEQASYDAGMLEGLAESALSGLNIDSAIVKEAKDTFNKAKEDAKKLGNDLKNLFGK